MLLAYPVALVMVRGNALVARLLAVIVIAPLLVNVVIRTYGWRVILANSDTGRAELGAWPLWVCPRCGCCIPSGPSSSARCMCSCR